MPTRNIGILGFAVLVSLACYSVAARNRYARIISQAMEIVEREALIVVPERELFNSAMRGMLSQLDKNSGFIAADQFQTHEENIKQEIVGVGIEFSMDPTSGGFRVDYVIPHAPADQAGVQNEDLVLTIDGKSLEGLESDKVVSLIRGPRGESVEFGIQRPAETELIQVSVVRDKFQVDSVRGDTRDQDGKWSFSLRADPQIGYIRLLQFGQRSADELRQAIESIQGKSSALILDLRYNSGGLLDQAIEICDFFIEPGKLVVQTRRRSDRNEYHYTSQTQLWDAEIPMVVLVNQESASASEIVAACLQDYGRAEIAGCQSYGKGTVQDIIPLEHRRSMLRLTTASYWRPSGKNIDRTVLKPEDEGDYGVKPQAVFLNVELTGEAYLDVRRQRQRQDRMTTQEIQDKAVPNPAETDPQLKAVVDYLRDLLQQTNAA